MSDRLRPNELPLPTPVDKTGKLLSLDINKDRITNLPYETNTTRQSILGIIQEASNGHQTIVYFAGDINLLKQLNDKFGHDTVNEVIEEIFQSQRRALGNINQPGDFYVYRPQAGGDEVKGLFVFAGNIDPEKAKTLIASVVQPETTFRGTSVTCSYGVISAQLVGGENPAEILQSLEQKADDELTLLKMKKINHDLLGTIILTNNLTPEEYVEVISANWGSRRPTERALRIIMMVHQSKIIKRQLTTTPPSRR